MISSEKAYRRIRDSVAGKDWEIVAFTDKTLVLRIGAENIEFDRSKGLVLSRFKL